MNAQIQPVDLYELEGQECPICRDGTFISVQIDWWIPIDNFLVQNVWVNRCDKCGEYVFPSETSNYIDAVLTEHNPNWKRKDIN